MSQQTSNDPGRGPAAGPSEAFGPGTPPGKGRVDIGQIRAKLAEIDHEVRGTTEIEGPGTRTTTLVAVGAAVTLIAVAYLLGRRRGRRKSTWVEVRRL